MKRASKDEVALTPLPEPVKPIRMCKREGCLNKLFPSQRFWCSFACRNAGDHSIDGGRPTLYKPEFSSLEKLKDYMEYVIDQNEPELIPTKVGFTVLPAKGKYPSEFDFGMWLGGYSVRTMNNWGVAHPEFGQVLDALKEFQKQFLLDYGLSGRYNPQIAKVILATQHGMVEKSEVDVKASMLALVEHVYDEASRIRQQHHEQLDTSR